MVERDSDLHRKVDKLERLSVQLNQVVGQVGVEIAGVGQKARETDDRLQRLARDFQSFVRQAQRTANVQRAEVRIGVLEAQLEHQFGHHNVVRRSAVGMLQGFDGGLVSEETVRGIGEQLMVQNPRYWLAPVLVALAAWAGDDRDLCDRAVQEAFRRAPDRTALFMALVLRRQGRRDSSVRWLRQYLAAQDPSALGRDFAVILECISQGAFGPAGMEIVQERLDAWRDLLLHDDAIHQAQVDRWRAEVDGHVGGPIRGDFRRLADLSPQWPQMERALACARAHRSLIDKYTALVVEEITPSERLEDSVDDILDQLVNEYDDEELPLRRDHALNTAIVKHDGDEGAAKREAATDSASLGTTLDYLTIQTSSALSPDSIGVSRATQRIAVASCHEWFERAHATFTRDYRQALPENVEVVFETSHNIGGTVFNLPRWKGSFAQPVETLEQSLSDHWDDASLPFIASFDFNWRKHTVLPVIAIMAAAVVLTLCLGWVGAVLGVIGWGIWALVLQSQVKAAAQRQREARDFVAKYKRDSITQLRAAGAEVTDWSETYRTADIEESTARDLIRNLATAGSAPSPHETRVVSDDVTIGGRR